MTSVWAQRWAGALDDDAPAAGRRAAQGVALLRSGRVSDVRVRTGAVTGRVQGDAATPLGVELAVAPLGDAAWRQVAAVLAAQVRHRARLLAGQVPEGLDAELAAAGIVLLPRRGDVAAVCGCDDAVSPCAHAVAVWLAAGRRIADDPFVVLRVRGRSRERLLAEVAASRRGGPVHSSAPGVDPASLDPVGWLRADGDLDALELPLGAPPRTVAGPLRLLGDPPGWSGGVSAADLFGPLVARGADWAAALLE